MQCPAREPRISSHPTQPRPLPRASLVTTLLQSNPELPAAFSQETHEGGRKPRVVAERPSPTFRTNRLLVPRVLPLTQSVRCLRVCGNRKTHGTLCSPINLSLHSFPEAPKLIPHVYSSVLICSITSHCSRWSLIS